MKTGFRGTFVISWSQTEVDGLEAAPVQSLDVGTTWCWQGDTVRVDGPNSLLRLENADNVADNHKRAARMVRRLVGAALSNSNDLEEIQLDEPLMDRGFVVTDGAQSYTVTVIEAGRGASPLLMFHNEIPPRNTEMWVVHHSLGDLRYSPTGSATGGVICFTLGT